MNSSQWFEITKEALRQAEADLDPSQIDLLVLLHPDYETQMFSTSTRQKEVENSVLLGQAWNSLIRILTFELQLEAWNSVTVKGRNKALTIYSLGFDVLLVILSDAATDPMDVVKVTLKYIFSVGYEKQYETVGLVSAEGFPVWVSSMKEMDDFLFAISITSLLTLVERIDMEVSAGGVTTCILQGTENMLLNVAFNPSQDLALAVTRQGSDLNEITLNSELNSLFQKIVDPVLFSAIVPEITDEDRERMLEEIRQAFEGETTEEEIQTLSAFDTEMLKSLEDEIKTVAKKYGANEISVGYLRRRMRLPAEVLSMALQYLIGEGSIEGRIGKARESGREILVLDLSAEISEEEQNQIKMVQTQIYDLFTPLSLFLSQLPKVQPPKAVALEVISDALGEFQIMLTLADTDPLFLLTNDLRTLGGNLRSSVKTLALVKKQLSETGQEDVLRDELERRHSNLLDRISEQRLTIVGKVTKFLENILNSYRFLTRLLPPPSEFKRLSKSKEQVAIIFKCSARDCNKNVCIQDNPLTWVKLSLFTILLGIQDNFPEKSPPVVTDLKNTLEEHLHDLVALAKETERKENSEQEYYLFLDNLNDLIITNTQRDDAITILKQSTIDQNKQDDFYTHFVQCNSCNKWFCKDHMFTATKCRYC